MSREDKPKVDCCDGQVHDAHDPQTGAVERACDEWSTQVHIQLSASDNEIMWSRLGFRAGHAAGVAEVGKIAERLHVQRVSGNGSYVAGWRSCASDMLAAIREANPECDLLGCD